MLVKYFVKEELSVDFIKNLIHSVNDQFIPSLSTTVNILEYSKKLQKSANCILLEENGNILAFIFFYFINNNKTSLYITLICSIKKGMGEKIYLELINRLLPNSIKLEVFRENHSAIAFYKKLGFVKEGEKSNEKKLFLKHELK